MGFAASARVRAPGFPAGTWFNTDRPLTLRELRGRYVLLDFWTSCCANCLHVLDELRPLEERFGDALTVVGVHSPKFAHERSDEAVRAAVERYQVEHPVLSDPDLQMWQQYAVRAWPTLVLVDPDGYVVAHAAGEGQVSGLGEIVAAARPDLAPAGDAIGPGQRAEAGRSGDTTLRFPAKAVVLPGGTLLVADAGHHQLVEFDGDEVVRRIGTGRRGRADGPAERAEFAEPNGLAVLPAGRAGFDVVVADTANHLLRGVRSSDGAVVATIDLAHELRDARTVTGPVPGVSDARGANHGHRALPAARFPAAVLSPWDAAWWPAIDRLVVAAAGVHLLLAVDPASGATEILAGTTVEGLRDGSALDGWLAQPSGLAVDGERVWFVDAETSALRYLTVAGKRATGKADADGSLASSLADKALHTAVGEGLFDFGHVDGPARDARLQHPLGVTLLADGSLAVLDTYNGAVRRYDPATDEVSTLASDLREPSGAVLVDGELVVVESAAHQLVRPVPRASLVRGPAMRTERPPLPVPPGPVTLAVRFEAPPGRVLDDRYGPPTRLDVTASPPGLLVSGAGESAPLERALTLAPSGDGVLQVVAQAASCDKVGEHPACYLARQDWGVPVRITPGADPYVELVLLG